MILITLFASWFLLPKAYSATLNATTRATMLTAVANAQPGDVVQIACGTYTNWGIIPLTITDDGTAANRIILRPVTPGCAIFSGQGALNLEVQSAFWTISGLAFQNQTGFGPFPSTGSAGGSLITLDGAQDVIVEDITITNVSGTGVPIPVMELNGPRPTTRITLRDITFSGYTQNQGSAVAILVYGQATRGYIRNVTIEDSVFENRTVSSLVSNNKWIRIGSDNTTYDANVKIRRNIFRNDTPNAPQQDVLAINASNVEVSDNIFERTAGVVLRRGVGQIFTRNKIINPNAVFNDAAVTVYDIGHTITNNLCYSTIGSKSCCRFGMGVPAAGADGIKDFIEFSNSLVAHTTIDGFTTSSIEMTTVDTGTLDGPTTVNPTNNTLINNAIRQDTGTMVTGNNCAASFSDIGNNNWSGAATPGCLTIGDNNTIAAPDWVSPEAGNYELVNSSALINSGTNIACQLYTETDLAGRLRDTSPDIGAYEFTDADPVIPPSATTCNDLFGSTPNYLLCEQRDLTCEFSAFTNNQSCDALCQSFGRVCVTSYDNPTNTCTRTVEELCSVTRTDQICVCKINEEASTPTASSNFYVDSSCPTPGNGTTQTCGATGPWNSLQYALEVVDCQGMQPGNILHVKGEATPQGDGSWYTESYYSPTAISPDSACAGVIVQNATGHHVVLDGTIDLSTRTWTHIGSNVYECQEPNCGVTENHPMTAWYKIGSGPEQRLQLIQSVQTCTTSIAAGYMIYNPVTQRVCAHLSDGSDPSNATYFRIPSNASAIDFSGEAVSGITFRHNPDLTGSFMITRYRDKLVGLDPSINANITIDGLNLSWAMQSGIESSGTAGVANYKFLNNEISHIGGVAIDWTGDLGMATITRNQIHDIGTALVTEACLGVGAGCLSGAVSLSTGIRINNCTAKDGQRKGTIQGNLIQNMGPGTSTYSRGIALEDCSYGNLVDANLILDSTTGDGDFYGIIFSGIPAGQYHDANIASNNRGRDIDNFFAWDTDTFTSQAGNRNDILGNTCHNPNTSCYIQEDGVGIGGSLFFQNNLAVIEDGYVKLVDVPSDTKWTAGFTTNGFECSDSACSNQDIATVQGTHYERLGDCTPTVDCIADIGNGNVYAPMLLDPDTMELLEGSNAVNRGRNLDRLPLDYLGNSRPIDAFSDMGAHEFQGESPSQALVQHGYRFYNTFVGDREDPLADENQTPDIYHGGIFTLRFSIAGDDINTAQYIAHLVPYYQHCNPTCGDWLPVSSTCTGTALCFVDHPSRENESPITNDLALDGRTYSDESRFIDDPTNAIPLLFRSTDQVELEYSFKMGSNIAVGHTVAIRIHNGDGSTISQYVSTPTITATVGKLKIIIGY